jgi:hypothetical protein
MATDLTGLKVKDTYNSLLKIGDNSSLSATPDRISDGLGNESALWISTARVGIGSTPDSNYTLTVSNNIKTQSLDASSSITASSLRLTGGSGTQGLMSWNTDEETIDVVQNGAVLQLGQEMHVHVKNQSGSTINDGTPVYVTGTLGASGRLTVAPMIADGSIEAKYFLGVTTEDIPNGEDGKVTTFGKIRGLNTSAYSEGQTLYVSSSTAGYWQTTPPAAPALDLEVAIVINSHANNGTLFIRAQNGYYLGMLHDVYLSSPANNQFLVYNASNSRWENSNDLVVNGNLTVSGTTTFIDTTNLNIGDAIITLNADIDGVTAPTEDAGIEVKRGSSANVSFLWDETNDRWTLGTEDLVAANFVGNLTGDISGNADTVDNKHATDFDLQYVTDNGFTTTNDISVGDGTANSILSVFFSDSSSTEIRGFGVVFNRDTSYLRPSSDATQTLYIGGAEANLDWSVISAKYSGSFILNQNGTEILRVDSDVNIASGNLEIAGTTVIDSSRNYSGGTGTFTGLTVQNGSVQNLDLVINNTQGNTLDRVRILTTAAGQRWDLENDQNLDIFKIRDATAGSDVFILNNGAPSNSLVVSSSGNISTVGEMTAIEYNLPSGGMLDWANGDARIVEGLVNNYSLSFQTYDGASATTALRLDGDNSATFESYLNVIRGNGSVNAPDTSDHTLGTRINFYEHATDGATWYSMGVEDSHLWFHSHRNYKWYRAGSEVMNLTEDDLTVQGKVVAKDWFVSDENTSIAGSSARDWVHLGAYGSSASRAAAVQIGDVDGARYAMISGAYDLTFAKHISSSDTWSNVMRFESLGVDTDADVRILNDLTIDGSLFVSGTIDLSDANLDIGSADIIFGIDATDTGARGLVWNFDADGNGTASNIGYIRAGGTVVGEKMQFNMNAEGTITGTGNVYEFKSGGTDIFNIGANGYLDIKGTINLPQNPVGTTYGNGVSTVPTYMFQQGAGDNDGIRMYAEAGVTNDVRYIFEVVDDIEEGDTWIFRNKKTYTDYLANEVVKISGAGDITAKSARLSTRLYIDSTAPIIELKDTDSTGAAITSYISYKDSGGNERGWVGFGSGGDTDFGIQNTLGSIRLYAPVITNSGVRVSGTLEIDAASAINLYGNGSGTYNRSTFYSDSTITAWEASLVSDSISAARTPFVFSWRGGYAAKGGLTLAGGLQLYTSDTGLGIDTSTPIAPIHTKRTSSGYGAFFENSQGGNGNYVDVGFNTYSVTQAGFANAGATIRVIDNGDYGGHFTVRTKSSGIAASDTERLRIDADNGYVGINRDDPDNQLTVRGTNALVDVQSTADSQTIGLLARYQNNATLGGRFIYTTGDAQLYIDNLYQGNNDVYSDITFRNCNTSGTLVERLKIKGSNGRVEINPTKQSIRSLRVYYDMEVYNSVLFTDTSYNVQSAVGGANGELYFYTNGTATRNMTILSGGQVLIGQTSNSTSQPLQVNGFIDQTATTAAFRLYNGSTFVGGLGNGQWAYSSTYLNDYAVYATNNLLLSAGDTYPSFIIKSDTKEIGFGDGTYNSGLYAISNNQTRSIDTNWGFQVQRTSGVDDYNVRMKFYPVAGTARKLGLYDARNNQWIAYVNGNKDSNPDFIVNTSTTGINTTSATSGTALDINGVAAIRGGNYLYFGHDGTNIGSWETRQYASSGEHLFNANAFRFSRDGYEGGNNIALRINSSKQVYVGYPNAIYGNFTVQSGSQYGAGVEHSNANSGTNYNDTLFLINTNQNNSNWAGIGFSTNGSDGQHHRAQIRAYYAGSIVGSLQFWMRDGSNPVERFRMDSNGKFHAANDIIAFSTTPSDQRLKDDVSTIDSALEKVKSLRGVEYIWNDGGRKGKKDIGFIAQEVEQVIPEIVSDQKLPFVGDGETEYKTVDYEKMVAVLVEAIKDQQKQIDELKEKLNV